MTTKTGKCWHGNEAATCPLGHTAHDYAEFRNGGDKTMTAEFPEPVMQLWIVEPRNGTRSLLVAAETEDRAGQLVREHGPVAYSMGAVVTPADIGREGVWREIPAGMARPSNPTGNWGKTGH